MHKVPPVGPQWGVCHNVTNILNPRNKTEIANLDVLISSFSKNTLHFMIGNPNRFHGRYTMIEKDLFLFDIPAL